ncbi:hypothetical protein VNO78_26143 [Psophocarpus tetragonolobus]|uniref:Uncharacterized protein n=1 Tax=Psophocarpus tetragonolobus TaxID=3891 RepID=A0AAN9S003_PSOTE
MMAFCFPLKSSNFIGQVRKLSPQRYILPSESIKIHDPKVSFIERHILPNETFKLFLPWWVSFLLDDVHLCPVLLLGGAPCWVQISFCQGFLQLSRWVTCLAQRILGSI